MAERVYRHKALKIAAMAMGVIALIAIMAGIVSAGLASPQKAYAAEQAGTYTVTANLYVDADDSPIGQNAYVTNAGNPPSNKPVSPVSDNATLTITEDGKKLLTVPIVNSTFGVLSIAAQSVDGTVITEDVKMGTWTVPNILWSTPYAERVTSIVFDVTNYTNNAVVDFSPCAEYASFALFKGDKTWDLHLVADLSVE